MHPAITVLISTYNHRRWVEKKLAEIQRQTLFERAEFVFIETASPGRERELLEPFCRRHGQCRLLALEERKTLYEAWNLGWEQARAPLICYSNMDDAMHPRLLEEVVEAFERRPWDLLSVLIAKQWDSDPQRDSWAPDRLRRLPLSTRPGPFTAWRTGVGTKIGRFDGRFVGAGDKDFWSRAVAGRLSAGWISRLLYLYTRSPAQLSKAAGAENRAARDVALTREKPYPLRWPAGYRWRVWWGRWELRLWPGRLCLPAAEGSRASAVQV